MNRNKLIFLVAILSACQGRPTSSVTEQEPQADTVSTAKAKIQSISKLNEQSDSISLFTAPNGKQYKVIQLPAESSLDTSTGFTELAAQLDCETDDYHGKDRKASKLSIVNASTEAFNSLNSFIETLKDDNSMINNSQISRDENNKRVKDEKRNIKLSNIFIYAMKREPDNDYHIIIGDENGLYFNIENSGLPDENQGDFNRLAKARKEVEDYFGEACNSNYQKFDPPIPVEIEGSIFYDIDHRPGAVGPEGFKPKTSWEIHPITKIVFK
ncbi:MAG TPA: hypothetical protein PLN13_09250 [Bacteroidia bacterium]|nr:hypothetical protein [Bacteroidia bacterium]HRH08754.1 hypothetical protein [Bacteroidia bacterium]